MNRTLYTLGAFIFFLFMTKSLSAQVAPQTGLRSLAFNTEISLAQEFTIPAGVNSLWLDSGKGKLCSCQFFVKDSQREKQYEKSQQFSLKQVTVKGLFDGSQMHVARIYFNESNDYFKFKCYTRNVLVQHVSEFLIFGSGIVVKQDESVKY
jgi:hypothetical protein